MLEFLQILSERCNLNVYTKYNEKVEKMEADPNISFKKLHSFNLMKWVKRDQKPTNEDDKKDGKSTKASKLDIKLPLENKDHSKSRTARLDADMSKNITSTLNKQLSTTESFDSEERTDLVSRNVRNNWFLYRGLGMMLPKTKSLRCIHFVDQKLA